MKEKDTRLRTSDLAKYLFNNVKGKVVGYRLEIDDWAISGRKGERGMAFNIKSVIDVQHEDGIETYVIADDDHICYENDKLTIVLPKRAITLD